MSSNALPTTEVEATDRLAEVFDFFENANVGLMLTDRAGTVRRANPAQRRLAGWPAGNSPELSARALVSDEVWALITGTLESGRALHNLAVTFQRGDGSTVDAVLDVNGDADGGLLRFVTRLGLQTPVPGPQDTAAYEWHTAWVQAGAAPLPDLTADEASATARELLGFFDQLPAAIHKIIPSAEMDWTNQAQLRMLGYAEDPGKFLGRGAIEFFPVAEDVAAMYDGLFVGGGVVNYPTHMRKSDGSDVAVFAYSTARVAANGEYLSTRCFVFYADAAEATDSLPDGPGR